jgi:CheY-like chemotaxis protein
MSKDETPTEKDWVAEYLAAHQILVVDANSSARTSLTATLVQMGANRHQMALVGSVEEARSEIKRIKPRLVFCDFIVGKESGLDLIKEQRKEYGPDANQCVFVLVTANGSQSAVARAAEEDVDTFIIKPYTMNTFRASLNEAIKNKLNPSEYLKIIAVGKQEMTDGAIEQALDKFESAKKLAEKPTLACFYAGQAELLKAALDEADASYREGLNHNKIHYKCLVGLFDLLMQQQKHKDAYEVVKKLAQYFPANPKRLASVLRLAIMTNHYNDIEGYYRIFTQIDQRTDELVRYTCSALSVTGKYFLKQNTRSRGIDLFEKVATSCAGRIQYMRYAVETMVNYGCQEEAERYLNRFPPELRGTKHYLISSLMVACASRPTGEVIQQARNLIQNGLDEAIVYQVLIAQSAKGGLKDEAEHLAQIAAKKWPAEAGNFRNALQTTAPSAAA